MTERRRYPRHKAKLEVKYYVENAFEIRCKTNTFNISKVGIAMPLNQAVKRGKRVKLVMKIPADSREIVALGKVVWKHPNGRSAMHEDDAGIKFLSMFEDSEDVLTEYLYDIAN